MKVFKSMAQESLIYGVGEQPGCGHLTLSTGVSTWPFNVPAVGSGTLRHRRQIH